MHTQLFHDGDLTAWTSERPNEIAELRLLAMYHTCQVCGKVLVPQMIWVVFEQVDENWRVKGFECMEHRRCGIPV